MPSPPPPPHPPPPPSSPPKKQRAGSFTLLRNSAHARAAFLNHGNRHGTTAGSPTRGVKLSSLASSTCGPAPSPSAGAPRLLTTDRAQELSPQRTGPHRQTGSTRTSSSAAATSTQLGSGIVDDARDSWAVGPSLARIPIFRVVLPRRFGKHRPYTHFPTHLLRSADSFPVTPTLSANIKYTAAPASFGSIVRPRPGGAVEYRCCSREQSDIGHTISLTDTLTFANGGGIFRTGNSTLTTLFM